MKKLLPLMILFSFSFILSAQLPPDVNIHDKEVQVRQALEAFSKAFVIADTTQLSGMLTENYLHSNNGGVPIGKKIWLQYVQSRKAALLAGTLRIDTYQNEEIIIKIYNNTAIVNGLNIAKGIQDSKFFATKIRFTHTWVQEDGIWKRASFHDSVIERR
ncbi:MAG: nuclear transport factor 2 family protein [Saprospiraceae bacterium]|nr:nuclear transport factor 2 family protein [Saprospiraceae bacterium]